MIRFINDIKKYHKFAIYSAKSDLKSEIANSHLSWLWWILDPLLFMIVYTFVALVVFSKGSGEEYFPVFVFIGLTTWGFFNKTLNGSVKLVTANSNIISKVYLPKFILVLIKMYVNGFKMLVSFSILVIMMIGYQVPVTPKIILVVPIFMLLFVITFGFSTIFLHFGVYVQDLSNILFVVLRLIFYLSGIFYSIEDRLAGKLPSPLNEWILTFNPMALIMASLRDVMLYGEYPHLLALCVWFIIGIVVSIIGINIIYKNENSYAKVI